MTITSVATTAKAQAERLNELAAAVADATQRLSDARMQLTMAEGDVKRELGFPLSAQFSLDYGFLAVVSA